MIKNELVNISRDLTHWGRDGFHGHMLNDGG